MGEPTKARRCKEVSLCQRKRERRMRPSTKDCPSCLVSLPSLLSFSLRSLLFFFFSFFVTLSLYLPMHSTFFTFLSLLSSLFSSFLLVFLLSLSYTFTLPLSYLILSLSPSRSSRPNPLLLITVIITRSLPSPHTAPFSFALFSPRASPLLLSLLQSD
ncbi:MAG: hypothetical protein JOS17DRAFT_613954 [Linnemannia elongata]|nr:MAG: hypothetical protein JOS17DRAFT_613954 [Linnemannia elongata]